LVISWSYSGIFVKRRTIALVKKLGRRILQTDSTKISNNDLSIKVESCVSNILDAEKCRLVFYGLVVPLFFMFGASIFLLWTTDERELAYIAIFILLESIIIITFTKIINICKMKWCADIVGGFLKKLISASNGVSYYSAESFVFERFDKAIGGATNFTNAIIEKSVWKSFFRLALLFCIILTAYIMQEDYWTVQYVPPGSLFCTSIVLYAAFLLSLLKCAELKPAAYDTLRQYANDAQDDSSLKELTSENMFVAFHGVYFRDIEESNNTTQIQNLTFSILPGEFVSITGENFVASSNLFNLLLKYLSPQSGNIYISGTPIKNIKTDSLRKEIGVFRQDFGIVDGTVYDNIRMAAEEEKTVIDIAERFDLVDDLGTHIFGDGNTMNVPQSTLFKIQAARIASRQPSILLIESPPFFEDRNTEQLFMDFVEDMAQKKTIVISTNCLKFIIYSDKTIYLGEDGESVFGTHASLANNKNYQSYINKLKMMQSRSKS
jgi:ABC-type multidrug transport system fused ATPase/permease subunit